MLRISKIIFYSILIVLLQVTILPKYLAYPFTPNLMLIFVSYLALRGDASLTLTFGITAYILGLIQGVFSGIYLGLSGFSFLLIFTFLNLMSEKLYADSGQLMVVIVFFATIADGLITLTLLLLFSVAGDIYQSILVNLLQQALVNALIASILFGVLSFDKKVEI